MLIDDSASSMATNTNLTVLHIPCDADHLYSFIKIPLVDVGPAGIGKEECNDFEKELQHIPNMKSLGKPKSFSWSHRHLIGRSEKNSPNESLNGDYMMYLCVDDQSGLPHNKTLERLVNVSKGRATWSVPISVYGDAFVFRMASTSSGLAGSKGAKYIDMKENFRGAFADSILQYLLMYPGKGEWK